jgi:protoporphyrinogen/coproporphyrinogen III oxidase
MTLAPHPSPHVVVIGAGVAGLAAARYLTKGGIRVTVLERNPYVGGRAYTEIRDGFAIDTGAGFLANFYTHTLQFIHELGLADEIVQIRDGGVLFADGRSHQMRRGLNRLSLRSRAALCKVLYPIIRHWREIDIHSFHDAHRLDVCSVAEYAERRLNRELLEDLFQPLLSSLFFWTPEQTSQAMLFLLLKAGLGMHRFTLRHGLGQLPEAMAGGLNVIKNIEVHSVTSSQSGGYVVLAREVGQDRHLVADGIVCAVPATAVTRLFTDLSACQHAFFQPISYSSTVITAIGLARRIAPNIGSLLVSRRDAGFECLTSATSHAAKNPAQVPGGCDLIKLSSSGIASGALLDQEDEVVRGRLVTDLQEAGLTYDRSRDELFYRVYRWPQALPLFDVGHFRRLKTFAGGEIESGTVVFAGDYLGGPFIEGAVTSGLDAGHRLLGRLTSR